MRFSSKLWVTRPVLTPIQSDDRRRRTETSGLIALVVVSGVVGPLESAPLLCSRWIGVLRPRLGFMAWVCSCIWFGVKPGTPGGSSLSRSSAWARGSVGDEGGNHLSPGLSWVVSVATGRIPFRRSGPKSCPYWGGLKPITSDIIVRACRITNPRPNSRWTIPVSVVV